MHRVRVAAGAFLACVAGCAAFGQSALTFDVASVKPSKSVVGRDGAITIDPARLIARNATLKRLIFEAWRVPWSQIAGGPQWLDSDEFDIDATAQSPASREQLSLMLRALLTDRFKLAVHSEMRERRVYALVAAKDGPKLSASSPREGSHLWRFHGDLSQFAGILSVQLTIPLLDDPATPSHASGAPVPVLNRTGIEGVYDIVLDIKPDAGSDAFTVWQRALEEQIGLRLESQRAPVEFLVVDRAERVPSEN